jgi:hypothetical protein
MEGKAAGLQSQHPLLLDTLLLPQLPLQVLLLLHVRHPCPPLLQWHRWSRAASLVLLDQHLPAFLLLGLLLLAFV